jgi:hypothetical protein
VVKVFEQGAPPTPPSAAGTGNHLIPVLHNPGAGNQVHPDSVNFFFIPGEIIQNISGPDFSGEFSVGCKDRISESLGDDFFKNFLQFSC